MKERMTERLTEKRIVEITNAAIDAPSHLFKIKGREWCIDLLGEIELLNQQLTEKDATIKKLQDMSQRWEKAFTNADKQYLKKEKEVAELRKMIEWRDERFKNANEQCDRLRKALEEIARIESHINITTIRMQEIAKSALGEGDKE
ncbi:hypothetical protein [Paenibacillus vini]|uniref:Uncharacterized protein n=1 Tax=Paenibacillus vini TaxID=1476024 RepID=A0ABQ4MKI3_9BACL|nr:hypothetical protein [Paenibacillus vini]GIP55930.1 hypothetical protein J42TS3_49650 [Paenibacillus vini]